MRVFISSTFRDFADERDLLAKRVFPELRRRARDRFVEIIDVDLRWGITEEQANDGQTLPLCLREIDRARPYFIGLLGERYGWTPGSDLYPDDLLARQPWLMEHAGRTSVTELEILHGVLNDPEMAGHATFYFRAPAWSAERGEAFRSESEEDRTRLNRLKNRLRESPFPTLDYETPEEFADRVLEDLWATIDAAHPADQVPDELERERRGHEAYAEARRRVYIGQEETVAALLSRLESASDEPGEEGSKTRVTLITGESGIGKSSLLANVLHEYRLRHPDDIVIEHYCASTSNAADGQSLSIRLRQELDRTMSPRNDLESNSADPERQFAQSMAAFAAGSRELGTTAILAVDGCEAVNRRDWQWLTANVPSHVRVLMSSPTADAFNESSREPLFEFPIPPLSTPSATNLLHRLLSRKGRALPTAIATRILSHQKAGNPLFLQTILEQLNGLGSSAMVAEGVATYLAADNLPDLLGIVMAELEKDLGINVVRRVVEAISISEPTGLRQEEILAITKISSRSYLMFESRLGGLLRTRYEGRRVLGSRIVKECVQRRYLPSAKLAAPAHARQLRYRVRSLMSSSLNEMEIAWARDKPLDADASFHAARIFELLFEIPSQRARALMLATPIGPRLLIHIHSVYYWRNLWRRFHDEDQRSGSGIDSALQQAWSEWERETASWGIHLKVQFLKNVLQILLTWNGREEFSLTIAETLYQTVVRDRNSTGALANKHQAEALTSLGRTFVRHQRFDRAFQVYLEARNLQQSELRSDPDPQIQQRIVHLTLDLSRLAWLQNNARPAQSLSKEAVDAARGLLEAEDNPWNRLLFARAIQEQHSLSESPESCLASLSEAEAVLRRSLDRHTAGHPTFGEANQACELAQVLLSRARLEGDLEHFNASVRLAKEAADWCAFDVYRCRLELRWDCFQLLGHLHARLGDDEESASWYRSAIAETDTWPRPLWNIQSLRRSDSLARLSHIEIGRGRVQAGYECYSESVRIIHDRLLGSRGGNSLSEHEKSICLETAGHILHYSRDNRSYNELGVDAHLRMGEILLILEAGELLEFYFFTLWRFRLARRHGKPYQWKKMRLELRERLGNRIYQPEMIPYWLGSAIRPVAQAILRKIVRMRRVGDI